MPRILLIVICYERWRRDEDLGNMEVVGARVVLSTQACDPGVRLNNTPSKSLPSESVGQKRKEEPAVKKVI